MSFNGQRLLIIKTYVISTVLGLITSTVAVYAVVNLPNPFSPNQALTADVLNSNLEAIATIGNGQDWVDMTSANNPTGETRVIGQVYQNTSGRPIMVAVSASGSQSQLSLYVGQALPADLRIAYAQDSNATFDAEFISAIIPDGYVYQVTAVSAVLVSWYELR